MNMEQRRRRIGRKKKPLKRRIKNLIEKNKITFIFLTIAFFFILFYLVSLHYYWKNIYTDHGFGYLFE